MRLRNHALRQLRERQTLLRATPESKQEIKIAPLGTYDVLLQLDHDPELGDLNERKIRHTFIIEVKSGERYPVAAEFRFPEWDIAAWGPASDYFNEGGDTLKNEIAGVTLDVSLKKKTDITEPNPRRWNQWQHVYFANIEISFGGTNPPAAIVMEDVPLRLFGPDEARRIFKKSFDEGGWDFDQFSQDDLKTGVAELFLKKMLVVEQTLDTVKNTLHEHRNLCEDFCCTSRIKVEDVAVCADVEVAPEADIELVLAKVLFEIEQYFNPGIKFYTLQELLAEGMPVDEIFEGPRLSHGFVKTADLENSALKSQLRTSDIINRLMEIEGVVAVKNLLLTRYDQDGQPVKGVADVRQGSDPEKISAAWTLELSDRCLPRLYVDNSRLLFFKNDLPFIPRASEVQDTLSQLRGEDERLKIRNLRPEELDLPVPKGEFRSPEDYFPVQYSFPLTYGIGFDGVREPATEKRRAQAKQLKGFLLFFEQLLANYLAQLSNVRKLFSLDETVAQTYFVRDLRDEAIIRGVTDLLKPELDSPKLRALAETKPEYLDRRNRFLDHLMARFAENFTDYALMLYSFETLKPVAQETLIDRKIAFLKDYPVISRERARSFNYKNIPQTPENQAVLRKRIARLLGLDEPMEERIIVVEHLLLRPKFQGDALMEVCLGKNCTNCGEEDPYSFQLTVVMPGWAEPFDENIALRRFADRTIRMEFPSHLLGKICWVSDLDYGEGWEKNLISPLQKLFREEGKNAGGAKPSEANALSGAEKIYEAAHALFVEWYEALPKKRPSEDEIKTDLDTLFRDKMTPLEDIYGGVKNYDEIGDKVFEMLVRHFTAVAVEDRWFHYTRFKEAWEEWLAANAGFEWCDEQVVRKIELALAGVEVKTRPGKSVACQLVERFGTAFTEEIKTCVLTGKTFTNKKQEVRRIFNLAFKQKKIKDFGIPEDQTDMLRELFAGIYAPYLTVTEKLWNVVLLLTDIESIYPPATLHDCDDGNDENPVRLGSTMLGGGVGK